MKVIDLAESEACPRTTYFVGKASMLLAQLRRTIRVTRLRNGVDAYGLVPQEG